MQGPRALSLARGFSGFGAALIFIPLASAIVGPRIASAVLLVVDGVLTLGMIPPAFRMADRREVFIMAHAALLSACQLEPCCFQRVIR